MVSLVQDAVAKEKLGCEPSQEFLIIDRGTFRVFLSFQISLHFVVPRLLSHQFSFEITTVCRFVQFPDDDPGSLIVPLDLEH